MNPSIWKWFYQTFRGIRRVVVHTILTVPLGQATEPKPLPLLSSPTGTTPSRGISVTGWTKQNVWWKGSDRSRAVWMSLSACRRRYTRPSTHRPVCYTASSTTLASTLMLKSYKDLSLRRDWSTSYGQSFSSRFIPSFSNYPLQVSLSVIITSCMYPSLSLLLV
jgi:hypothetical protein